MAARWYWQADHGWVEYAAPIAKLIEDGHQKKEKKIRVDMERFVDLADMLQRRYDDESKRRPVKREWDASAAPAVPPPPKAKEIFKKEVFYILASSQKKKDKLSEDSALHGALIAEHFTPPKPGKNQITHVICSEADVPSFAGVLDGMVAAGVEIVTPEFITDSILEEAVQDAAKYRLSIKKSIASTPSIAVAPIAGIVHLPMEGIKYAPYPFEVVVQSVQGDKFTGYAYWPTLGKTKTGIVGKIDGSNISFEETSYIENDGVELNNKYSGTLSAAGLSGNFTDNIGLEGRFELKTTH